MDGDQLLIAYQLFQLRLVVDAGQLEAVNFFILAEHGLMRATQHRVPLDAAGMTAMASVAMSRRCAGSDQ